jgi:putative tryptophan/tyrosine transport system substrate-binding protein
MRSRPIIVIGVLVALVVGPAAVEAQPAGKLPRLGVLWPGTVPRYEDAFRKELRDRGYIEGQNIAIAYRDTKGDMSRAPQLAAELVRLNVDVIFAAVLPEARAAQAAARDAGRTIPIVFGPVVDPVGEGLVASLAQPGGHMTGLKLFDSALQAKQLQILKEAVPRATRVAWLETPGLATESYTEAVESAGKAMGIRRYSVALTRPEGLVTALAEIARRQPDAVMVAMSPIAIANRYRIVEFAARHRLPAIYGDALFVEDGGLMFYGTSFASYFRRAASYVDKIIKGTKPADLPVEQPDKYELVINLKTAKTLGLTIPPPLLLRADEVIQ